MCLQCYDIIIKYLAILDVTCYDVCDIFRMTYYIYFSEVILLFVIKQYTQLSYAISFPSFGMISLLWCRYDKVLHGTRTKIKMTDLTNFLRGIWPTSVSWRETSNNLTRLAIYINSDFRLIKMFNNNTPQTPPNKGQPLSSSTPMLGTPVNPPPKVSSKTCLPRPLFHDEPETFSTKKQKREGGLFRPPPRPPAKSCPPKSRVFRHRNLLKTQAISFNDTADKHAVATETPLNSSVYDDKKTESYFEQAFVIEKKIGAGYFGK